MMGSMRSAPEVLVLGEVFAGGGDWVDVSIVAIWSGAVDGACMVMTESPIASSSCDVSDISASGGAAEAATFLTGGVIEEGEGGRGEGGLDEGAGDEVAPNSDASLSSGFASSI